MDDNNCTILGVECWLALLVFFIGLLFGFFAMAAAAGVAGL